MICENCGIEHNGKYNSRFCCKSCARSFSTKNIDRTLLKQSKCSICGEILYIKPTAPAKNIKCEKCKNICFCPICGRIKNKNNECDNVFCNQHNFQHFKSLIKYFGFDKSKYGTIEVEDEFNRIRDILYDLYWNKNLSSSEIAKMFNYNSNPTNITQKFFKKYLNIPVKSCKYATKENYIENRNIISTDNNSKYKHGWHVTWDNKEVYYRSQYELDYALELDAQHIIYEMENLRIKYFDSQKQEYCCAIPDFYIPEENMIVEIKSNYTLNLQNMKDKFKAYRELGYNCKCICERVEIQI